MSELCLLFNGKTFTRTQQSQISVHLRSTSRSVVKGESLIWRNKVINYMVLKTAGCCTVHHERTVALYRDYKIPLCFFFYKYYYFFANKLQEQTSLALFLLGLRAVLPTLPFLDWIDITESMAEPFYWIESSVKSNYFLQKTWKLLFVGTACQAWHFSRQKSDMSPPGLKTQLSPNRQNVREADSFAVGRYQILNLYPRTGTKIWVFIERRLVLVPSLIALEPWP